MNRKLTASQKNHFIWGNQCEGWHLLNTPELSFIKETMPIGTQEEKHYHEKAQQIFYILAGEATFIVKDETIHLIAGESILVPPKYAHQISNEAKKDLTFLIISTPSTVDDRINLDKAHNNLTLSSR